MDSRLSHLLFSVSLLQFLNYFFLDALADFHVKGAIYALPPYEFFPTRPGAVHITTPTSAAIVRDQFTLGTGAQADQPALVILNATAQTAPAWGMFPRRHMAPARSRFLGCCNLRRRGAFFGLLRSCCDFSRLLRRRFRFFALFFLYMLLG